MRRISRSWRSLGSRPFRRRHSAQQPAKAEAPPTFQPEPFWPKPLPENWILGQVAGIATAPERQHLDSASPRVAARRREGRAEEPARVPNAARRRRRCWSSTPTAICCATGAARAPATSGCKNEHGLHVDKDGNVWVGGNNDGDQILQFTPDGKFIRQIGKDDGTKGPRSDDTARLNRPAHMFTDDAANEIFVADGYGNRRVIVFDSKTGAYKRHWGAYGNPPNDDKQPPYSPTAELSKQFANPVHCVRVSNDGLVYVCDRAEQPHPGVPARTAPS